MAKRRSTNTPRHLKPGFTPDAEKFENVHQVAGIRTALLSPGTSEATQVALVNTGSGLRFTVALDRGGDIVDASYNQHSLTYLTANGLRPPNHAFHRDMEWLCNWPGGLLTTCGPQYIGPPRVEDGVEIGLHGHHSNTPASVEMLINPDPHRGRREMILSLVVRDSRMFGPVIEVRRTIQCIIGQPRIQIYDQVTNRGNERSAHHWLYHVNVGYPLLDRGAEFIYRGAATYWENPPASRRPTEAALNRLKRATNPLPKHTGSSERGMVIQVPGNTNGDCHVGLINRRLGLGLELVYPATELPRIANWQHYGPRGCYVAGIEPISGSLMGKANDSFEAAEQYLAPGQTRRYQLTMQIHDTGPALDRFAHYDGKIYYVKDRE